MAKFLITADYTLEGVRGVQRAGGSARRDAVVAALETVGGKLELPLRLRRPRRLRGR